MNKGFGVLLVSIMLVSGCAGADVPEPEFEGVRVLMRYDFGVQEYASVDSAKQEMEAWVEAYNTESPEEHYTGTMAFADIRETEEGYLAYLDCGDMENFAGVYVYSLGDGIAWEPEDPVMVIDTVTGEEVALDGAFLTGLPSSYQMVYGPVRSLLMGSDQIVVEGHGPVRYASIGWTQEGELITADPVALYAQEEGYFAILYEREGGAKDPGKYSWVSILVVGVLGIAGIVVLSIYEGHTR